MVDRIQLVKDVYMKIDNQWQIVLSGTVIDVPSSLAYSGPQITVLSPAQPSGVLASHGGPTSVSGKRTR
jgi:hypothetical protein